MSSMAFLSAPSGGVDSGGRQPFFLVQFPANDQKARLRRDGLVLPLHRAVDQVEVGVDNRPLVLELGQEALEIACLLRWLSPRVRPNRFTCRRRRHVCPRRIEELIAFLDRVLVAAETGADAGLGESAILHADNLDGRP